MANSKHKRVCGLCKASFYYCFRCGEDKDKETWHMMWDTKNCMEIDSILSNYGAKIIDAETAYTLLQSKDVSRKEFWNDSFKAAYDEIMKVGKPSTHEEIQPKVEQPEPKVQPVNDPFTRPAVPLSKAVEPAPAPAKEEKLSVSEELKKHDSAKAKSKKK